jgi:hypothetical protein
MLTTEQIRGLSPDDKLLYTFSSGRQLEGKVTGVSPDGTVGVRYEDGYWIGYPVDDKEWAQIDLGPEVPEEASSSTLYRRVRRLLERAFIPEPTINCIMLLVCGGELERDRETKAVSATAEKAEAQFWTECLKEINKPELFAPSPSRARLAPEGQCHDCDVYRKDGTKYHPSHDAAPLCDSGGRPHCTCDVCF